MNKIKERFLITKEWIMIMNSTTAIPYFIDTRPRNFIIKAKVLPYWKANLYKWLLKKL